MMNIAEIYPLAQKDQQTELIQPFINALLIRTNFLSAIRYNLGWRGLNLKYSQRDTWTFKLDGMQGVYGIYCHKDINCIDHYEGVFPIYYFPDPEDQLLESFSLEAIANVGQSDYFNWVRDFLSYENFKELFVIGELKIDILHNLKALKCSLKAQDNSTTVFKDDVYANIGQEKHGIFKKGETDKNLPSYDMCFPFFELLSATLTYNLKETPNKLQSYDIQEESLGNYKVLSLTYGDDFSIFENHNGTNVFSWTIEEKYSPPFENAKWWTLDPEKHGKPKFTTDNNKVQLIVLSGYLGSGKTTFVKNFIDYHTRNRRFVAVIQNEIGETGLDGKILEDDYAVLEMDEGCICCSLAGQLKKGIQSILEKYNPEVIILETSGVANPFNLLAEIEEVKTLVNLVSVTTMVDAIHFNTALKQSEIVREQVLAADIILMNKSDLIHTKDADDLRMTLHAINEKAEIINCTYADINPAILYHHENIENTHLTISTNKHHHVHKEDHLSSRKISLHHIMDRQCFISTINSIKDLAFRIKGIVRFKDSPDQFLFQFVNGTYEVSEAGVKPFDENYLIFIGDQSKISKINQNIFFNYKSN